MVQSPGHLTKAQESSLDGTYTCMLHKIFIISWRDNGLMDAGQMISCMVPFHAYISSIITERRLTLCGHMFRHDQPAALRFSFGNLRLDIKSAILKPL